MPKLQEQESQKLYYFTNDKGRKMKKFSGDDISEMEIREFDIPEYLIERPPKNKEKNGRQ